MKRIEPFMYQFYIMAWWSYIIFVDALLALKTGRHHVFNRRFFSLAIMSVAFWCLFELLNLRLKNWFYIGLPSSPALRFGGYYLAYATVIPAIYATERLLALLIPDVRIKRLSGIYRGYAVPLGVLFLVLSLMFPLQCFGLAWIFLAFIVDGYNYRKGYDSFMNDLEQGSLKRVVTSALAGMICGLLWEFWNYWSLAKWVYTVPFFEDLKIFEMAAPGYLGFALFALETIAFVNLLEKGLFPRKARFAASLLALVLSFGTFFLVDRYTVFSYTAPVERLTFLSGATRAALERKGVHTSYAIDPRMLNDQERRALVLMHLRGLGLANLEKLQAHGVSSIGCLASLSQEQLSLLMGEQNMRRVRIYLRAAREYRRVHPY